MALAPALLLIPLAQGLATELEVIVVNLGDFDPSFGAVLDRAGGMVRAVRMRLLF